MKSLFSIVLLALAALSAHAANTVTLTSNLVSGDGSVAPTLTWSTSPAADSCAASGGWTGTKAASGSEALPAFTSTRNFTLVCTWTGHATISWVAPTVNTDGSPLTDLAGYKLYKQVDSGSFNLAQTITPATALQAIDGPLTIGTYSYYVTAFNAQGVQSDPSNTVSKTIAALSDTQQITISVNPKPASPSSVAIE